MTEQAIDIVIKAQDQASSVMKKIQGKAVSMSDTLQTVGKVSAVAFGLLTAAIYKGKTAIEEDAQATFRLEKLLKTASKATDQQVASLIAQADALEKTTVAGKDMIMTTQSQLATFNLQASTIEKLTPAILDYVVAEKGATASADDYRQMTNGLAQALNGNFASLTKSGFVLDEHTKNLIKNGTEAEKAQAIYEVLGSTYKGFAEGATQTAIGRQIMLNKSLEDISKIMATAVIPIIDELKIKILDISLAVLKWSEEHPELTKNIILATVALTAIGAAILILGPIVTALSGIIAFGTTVVTGLGVALAFVAANPIVLIMAAIVALAGALYLVWKNWDSIKANLVMLWNQIKIDISAIVLGLKQYIMGVFDTIGTYVGEKVDYLKQKAQEAIAFVRSIMDSYSQSSVGQAVGNFGGAVYDATHGARATGGSMTSNMPYLVGERGPEVVIPKSSSTVVPNGGTGMGMSVSINLGGVSVRNDGDIAMMTRSIEDSLTRKLQLFKLGVS